MALAEFISLMLAWNSYQVWAKFIFKDGSVGVCVLVTQMQLLFVAAHILININMKNPLIMVVTAIVYLYISISISFSNKRRYLANIVWQ